MASSIDIDHEEDLTSDIMTTISAALVLNPKFNFGKLIELSTEINADKNKVVFTDIITIAFLNYLEMTEAAEVLSTDNVAAHAGFVALNLDKKESLSWFIRFISVTNPGIIATLSQTLMSVVNGIMLQNTRSSDSTRLHTVKAKLDKFVNSGELEKRSERVIEDKPAAERVHKREVSNLGLIGWMTGYNSAKIKSSRSSSNSTTNSTNRNDKKPNDKSLTKDQEKNKKKNRIDEPEESLSEHLSKLEIDLTPLAPEDSASNISSARDVVQSSSKKQLAPMKSAMKKRVQLRKDDSIVSG